MIERPLRSRLLAEVLGTYALVFIGPGAAVVDSWSDGRVGHVGIALSFALVIFATVGAFQQISGAHFNPAVTFGLWSVGRIPWQVGVQYALCQLLAGVLAALTLKALLGPHVSSAVTYPAIGSLASAGVEFILTAFLMLVILGTSGSSTAALAIGAAVGFDALMGGPLTGASMNPARSFGPALVAGEWSGHWSYWAGPLLGALAATRLHHILHGSTTDVGA